MKLTVLFSLLPASHRDYRTKCREQKANLAGFRRGRGRTGSCGFEGGNLADIVNGEISRDITRQASCEIGEVESVITGRERHRSTSDCDQRSAWKAWNIGQARTRGGTVPLNQPEVSHGGREIERDGGDRRGRRRTSQSKAEQIIGKTRRAVVTCRHNVIQRRRSSAARHRNRSNSVVGRVLDPIRPRTARKKAEEKEASD